MKCENGEVDHAGRHVTGRTVLRAVVTGLVIGLVASCVRDLPLNGLDQNSIRIIREIEAGRATTPHVEQLTPGAEAMVTFLVKETGGEVPRIVSDVTGWGVRPDDETFDLDVGTMVRIGSTDWYRLQTRVASRARIEYLIVHGRTDYRIDPNNPRRADFHTAGPVSEMVTPDYVPPPALTEAHETFRGRTVEVLVDGTSKTRADMLTGREPGNRLVHFPGEATWAGRLADVRVTACGKHSLVGELAELRD
mgnify:CR=1 FL=1